ncbi:hypothetical protein GCM10028803_21900 [Larkinella knui]|uniref:Phage tail protein n=1 Tax=Larkinella knui TaxID=2025310 RepID=A0A3P1CV83_9BACT|nr:phage tail protein [Larkinella knui]RRB17267.1 phage tail protein [Larkinella knui]
MVTYPPVGFHFSVVFELFPQLPNDFRFQEVSGLEVEMEMETVREGGQNRSVHQLPVRSKYSDLTLKRGLFTGSAITVWCKRAIEDFSFQPTNVLISLLNSDHLPLQSWYVVNAIPKRWQVGAFNAEQNSVVIESLTLSYTHFNYLSVDTAASAGLAGTGAALGF